MTLFIAGQRGRAQLNLLGNLFTVGRASLPAPPPGQSDGPRFNSQVPGIGVSSTDVLDFVKARGFIGERYLIRSRDGTPLSVYHIINPHADPKTLNRYPVLLHHGVTTDAVSMVAYSEQTRARPPTPGEVKIDPQGDTSIAFALANNNFDVWLADSRGTNFNNHLFAQEMDPIEVQKFWNFSLDEQINYDLPALIDFVLQQTHSDRFHYVAFSQSTLMMFALLSQSPDYAARLVSFVALAPVAYVTGIKGLSLSYFAGVSLIPDAINGNLIPQSLSDTFELAANKMCTNQLVMAAVCKPLSASISGPSAHENSADLLSAHVKGTSFKAIKHLIQMYQQQRFGKYDYGPLMNLRLYGSAKPPDYNLTNIHLPGIILFRGSRDFLSTPQDQEILLQRLGTKPYRDFLYPYYNHLDFLQGKSVVRDVVEPAVRLMLELAQQTAAQTGARSVLRDPEQANQLAPFKPLVVKVPDGSREFGYKRNMFSNLVTGLAQMGQLEAKSPPVRLLPGLNKLTDTLQSFAAAQNTGPNLQLPNSNSAQQVGAQAVASGG